MHSQLPLASTPNQFIKVSAYIPVHNGQDTIAQTLQSLLDQTYPIDEILILNDGSTDSTLSIVQPYPVRIINNPIKLGRGATRALAILSCQNSYIVSCDVGLTLPKDFISKSLAHFTGPGAQTVSGVYGFCYIKPDTFASHRWQTRHIQRLPEFLKLDTYALLETGACMLDRSKIVTCGNFEANCIHGEDVSLGRRLIQNGYQVIFDPTLHVYTHKKYSWSQTLERYSRWTAKCNPGLSILYYKRTIFYASRFMIRKDLKDKDWKGALLTLLCPHHCFFFKLREWITLFYKGKGLP
jgi:glycosyltransferase involved in cell wall biosynthesis